MKKGLLALLLLGMISIPKTALADTVTNTNEHLGHAHEYSELEITPLSLPCPVYGDFNHKYTNKIFLRQETKTSTHNEIINGNSFKCTITRTYNVYRRECACGYYTASPYVYELVSESHSLK